MNGDRDEEMQEVAMFPDAAEREALFARKRPENNVRESLLPPSLKEVHAGPSHVRKDSPENGSTK